jgi:hypothetical protein
MKRFLVCLACSVMLLAPPASAQGRMDYIYNLLSGFHGASVPDDSIHNDDGTHEIARLLSGDLVPNEKAALGLAEALVRGRFDDEMLRKNQPLTVRREGEFWFVQGRKNGSFSSFVRINRVDARIDGFLFYDPDNPPFPQVTRPHPGEGDCHSSCHAPEKK